MATGYDNVIADGESIWLELPENHINRTSFKKRQLTSSRQYYTFNGVTLHKQLELEIGRIPRRQKLAVRIPRDEPSSRLQKGRWYIHAHQIKFLIGGNKSHEWRSLNTKRLIRELRTTFESYYHPRLNQHRLPSSNRKHENYNTRKKRGNVSKTRNLPTLQKNQPKILANHGPPPIYFPWPMQAPLPWMNPHYYTGQVPQSTPTQPWNLPSINHQPVLQATGNYSNQASPGFLHVQPGGIPIQQAPTTIISNPGALRKSPMLMNCDDTAGVGTLEYRNC